jgi:hypothetical protein
MKSMNDTGPANGTLIFSLAPSRAVSGLSRDRRQNAVVPRNVTPMRVTSAAVSSVALLMESGEACEDLQWGAARSPGLAVSRYCS